MAITSATSRNDYAGNDAVDTYAYTFKIFLESDLVVIVRDADGAETTLTLTTHYTVTGEGNEGGGNVALVNGAFDWLDGDGDLASGYTISIRRVRPLTQTADFRNQGEFYASAHEDAFDKLVMIDQQQQDTIDRSFRLPPTVDPDDFEARIPASVLTSPGYVLAVNDDADGLTLIQVPDLDTVIDLDLGSSGNPGSLDIFPATAARGRLRFTAANSAGDTVTAIVNASQAAARTYTIPDAGTDASFVMTAGTQSIAGVKTFTTTGCSFTVASGAVGLSLVTSGNTGSDSAAFLIQVGGTSASDPFINWAVSGGGSFVMGIDNSASDILKISSGSALGTNDVAFFASTEVNFRVNSYTERTDTANPVIHHIWNDDTTTGTASAKLYLRTGGASAGDPFIHFEVGSAGVWTMGIDNSASDAFVIAASSALGTTNVISMTSGTVSMPVGSSTVAGFGFNSVLGFGSNVGGNILYVIANGNYVFLFDDGGSNYSRNNLSPDANNTYSLGDTTNKWTAVWAVNGTIQTSSLKTKTNVAFMSKDDCKIPRAIKFNRPSDKHQSLQVGFAADDLPAECFAVIDSETGERSDEDVYLSSVVGMLCQAARNDYDQIKAMAQRIEELEKKLAA